MCYLCSTTIGVSSRRARDPRRSRPVPPSFLADTGIPVLSWEQAVETAADLVVPASFGVQLHLLSGKLPVHSHGVGYAERLATPNTGSGAEPASVFGMAPERLLSRGAPVADALVLSHPEQYERLRIACPWTAPTAVLAGDPCFDRILAARPCRERFRRALGVRTGQQLILLNSTWNSESLFGDAAPTARSRGRDNHRPPARPVAGPRTG